MGLIFIKFFCGCCFLSSNKLLKPWNMDGGMNICECGEKYNVNGKGDILEQE